MLKLYNAMTFIIAFTGCASLFLSGEINPALALSGAAMIYGYYRSLKGMPQAPKKAISLLSVITLLVFIADAFLLSNDYLISVANLTILFQAIKSYDLKEPWDNLQVYFMSLLQLIITSELTRSLAFGALFLLFLLFFVIAMILAHFQKEGVRVNILSKGKKTLFFISILSLLLTAIIFVSLPRISGGIWGKSHMQSIRTAGFSEKVDFGSFGNVKIDPTIVMRVEISGNRAGHFYWRGMSHNYFDGIAWRDIAEGRQWMYRRDGYFQLQNFRKEQAVVQKIYLEPMDTDVLFGLAEIAALEVTSRVLTYDNAKALFIPYKKGKQLAYTVYSVQEEPPLATENRYYLQLPQGIQKVMRLAGTITAGKKRDIDKAFAVEKYLRENYTYSLTTTAPPEGVSPIEYFLFESGKGYCEHYATAMVLMLRSLGIPARIVTGFYGGELNTYSDYIIVRQSDAHSWVEALINKRWKRFDPTPAVAVQRPSALDLYLDMLRMNWNRYVVSFSASDQRTMISFLAWPFKVPDIWNVHIRAIRPWLPPVLSLVCFTGSIVLVLFLIRRNRLRRHGFATLQYILLRKQMKKNGFEITASSTPSEVAGKAAGSGVGENVAAFVRMYEEFRFGRREMSAENRLRYGQLLNKIKKQLQGQSLSHNRVKE